RSEDGVAAASVDVWAGVAEMLERIFAGEVDASSIVQQVLLSRTRRVGDRSAARRSTTRVEIDNRLSREFTVVDVYASDRPGLLFLVADSMFQLGLDIHLAKISTHLTAVLDVFYVTDAGRSKIEDAGRIEQIASAIAGALDREEV